MEENAAGDKRSIFSPGGDANGKEAPFAPSVRTASLAGAMAIFNGFDGYQSKFSEITGRARKVFARRAWGNMQDDAVERLELYARQMADVVRSLGDLLGDGLLDRQLWAEMKGIYSHRIQSHDAWELAETFFNSAVRKVFEMNGVVPVMEFVDSDFETPPMWSKAAVYRSYRIPVLKGSLVRRVLGDFPLSARFRDIGSDSAMIVSEIRKRLPEMDKNGGAQCIEMLEAPFYRNMGCYLVGRIASASRIVPLVIALVNTREGVVANGVIMDAEGVNIIFGCSRSYFHVAAHRPYELVNFLKTLMPTKRIADLYIAIGYNKHGKTELHRDLKCYMNTCDARFEISPGKLGMVMTVFNMPLENLVFKVIKDQFSYPKKATRQLVIDKYDFVFKRDRVGRLLGTQTFENLKFRRCSFSEELLEQLVRVASGSIAVSGDYVRIRHVYIERRVTPLDLYLQKVDAASAQMAVIDFGMAVKDLARSDIFPGDLLLKNFGVTRHGRVVFYDYDEICSVTECNFRKIPRSRRYEDELESEPWYHVGEHDVFPEEIFRFLGLSEELKTVLMRHHSDLFHVGFWLKTQEGLRAGRPMHIFPYRPVNIRE